MGRASRRKRERRAQQLDWWTQQSGNLVSPGALTHEQFLEGLDRIVEDAERTRRQYGGYGTGKYVPRPKMEGDFGTVVLLDEARMLSSVEEWHKLAAELREFHGTPQLVQVIQRIGPKYN